MTIPIDLCSIYVTAFERKKFVEFLKNIQEGDCRFFKINNGWDLTHEENWIETNKKRCNAVLIKDKLYVNGNSVWGR